MSSPTKEQTEAAAALADFWAGVKRNQPEVTWRYENTKLVMTLGPVEYEGKQYTPGELFYPAAGRAKMLIQQRLAKLIFTAQTTRKAGEIIPLEALSRPPASFEGLPIDCGTVSVYYPNYYPPTYHYDRGCTLKVPAFLPWPESYEEITGEINPNGWNQFVRCSILNDTDLLRAFVPLPWPWPLNREHYQFFLNRPTVSRLGYTIETIPGFTFGNQEGPAVSLFSPQIPC